MSLVSAATVAQWVLGTDTEDTPLALIHTGIENMLDHATGRTLASTTYTDAKLDGHGMSHIFLPHCPVTAVTSVEIEYYGELTYAGDETTDYRWDSSGTITYLDGIFPVGTGNITVTYTGGFTTCPADLSLLVCRLCEDVYRKHNEVEDGAAEVTIGSIRKKLLNTYDKPEIQQIITRYRRVMIGV